VVADGRIRTKDESVDDAAKRVLAELTGLENVIWNKSVHFGAIDRDPGERVVSVAYYALHQYK
jgi:ADP-ribose pyrophosphatase YjhB (NUDIX family)